MTASTLLLCNPGSRSGHRAVDSVRRQLEVLGEVEFRRPDRPEQLPELIRELGPGAERVVLGGGDGTINLALDALIECRRPTGILPLGTANDLARSLEIPSDLDLAIQVILHDHTRRIDIGRANEVSFVNAIGMGLGPHMTRAMDDGEKSRFGVLAYLFGIVRALRGYPRFIAEIECDGRRRRVECVQITVANGIRYGGGMIVADDAKLDDGRLDVLVVRRQSRLSLLGNALRFRTGQTRAADTIGHFRCEHVSIRTEPKLEITADGEFLTATPVACTVKPRCLEVYAPE